MKRLLTLGLAVAALTAPVAAAREEPPTAPLDERLRRLEDELERLGAGASSPPAGDAPVKLGLFSIESADGSHRLELHGRLMLDGRFSARADDDGFQLRRGRFDVSGRLAEVFTFKLSLEFGRTSDADLRDAYLNLAVVDWLQLRAGQMLAPFSTEGLTSSNFMKFPERPIVVGSLADSREVGVLLHGRAFGGTLAYYAGVFNGNGQNRATDDDDRKDVALRLEVAPSTWLLLAASYRYTPANREGSRGPADVRTVGNQLTRFLDYDTTNNRHRGHRQRGSLDARVRLGSLEVKGEVLFDHWAGMVSGDRARADLLNWGWFVDASYVLTRERSQDTIDPACPFYGHGGFGPGAWEASVRYEEFHAAPDTLTGGFAVGARTTRATSLALTWIPVKRVRATLSYTYSDFDGLAVDAEGHRRADDHAVIVRLGLWF